MAWVLSCSDAQFDEQQNATDYPELQEDCYTQLYAGIRDGIKQLEQYEKRLIQYFKDLTIQQSEIGAKLELLKFEQEKSFMLMFESIMDAKKDTDN